MILVDTSIWIDHLRRSVADLADLLLHRRVLVHPAVIGEIALGSIADRDVVIGLMRNLPSAVTATDTEVVDFIGAHHLQGLGIGFVDAHLLASTKLTPGTRLWTRDKRLHAAAETLGCHASLR